ncbi:hypothetical protein AURDEDRAFT_111484 [Auricularia subglabra TFB-10046 SS5]|nr:hypothetical protein AURDEDRAFT_111484 [Auricularia subglabra TFB-10046 SS5]
MPSLPARAFTFVLHPILGVWGASATSTSGATTGSSQADDDDLERGTRPPQFSEPAPAYVADDFFSRGRVLEHSTTIDLGRPSADAPSLPPYTPPGHLVTVDEDGNFVSHEPSTIARELFKYGFMFPPFWVIGACIMFSELKEPSFGWEEKTENEKRLLLESTRVTELKWAKRCLLAFFTLILIIGVAVGLALAVITTRHST